MKRRNLVLLLCLLLCEAMAQPTHKAILPKVGNDAFYRIDLPYEVLGGARPDLADLRITDDKGKEVAWLLREDVESKNSNEFIPLPMDVSSMPRRTDLLITGAGKPLASFFLRIKNADVSKEAALLGSDDGVKWFAVKDRFQLSRANDSNQTEALLGVTFPLSDYQYYKLSLNDSLSAPLNVIGVGQMKAESYNKQHLLEVPLARSRVSTHEKETEIELVLPFKFQFERLDFYISSPRYFRRNLRLAQPFGEAVVLSDAGGSPQPVSMSGYSDTLRLSISNGDDRPLGIDSIKVYVRKYSVVAALEKDEEYTLTYGDPQAKFPQYDLSFSKQIPDQIDRVLISHIERIPADASLKETPSPWLVFLKTYGIWLVIILVIAQILYMVRKMISSKPDDETRDRQ